MRRPGHSRHAGRRYRLDRRVRCRSARCNVGRPSRKAQVSEFFKQVAQTVNFSRFEPKEFIATGDKVVVLVHYRATTMMGKTFDSDFAMVFRVRDGRVIEFQEFTDSAAVNAAYQVGASV